MLKLGRCLGYNSHGLLMLDIAPCFLKGLDLVCSNGPSCLKISIKCTGSRASSCLYHSSCAKLTHHIHYALFWVSDIWKVLRICLDLQCNWSISGFLYLVLWLALTKHYVFYHLGSISTVRSYFRVFQFNDDRIWFCSRVISSLSWGFILPAQTPRISVLHNYCLLLYWHLQQVSRLGPKGGDPRHSSSSPGMGSYFSVADWKENVAFIMLRI